MASSIAASSRSSERKLEMRSGRQISQASGSANAATSSAPGSTSSRRCQPGGTSKAKDSRRSDGSGANEIVSQASGGIAITVSARTGSTSGESNASPSAHSKRAISAAGDPP